MIRTAIIGVSGFANEHYHDLLRETAAGRLQIVSATVINQAEEAEKCARLRGLGCRIFDDYRLMLEAMAGHLDLCVIPTGIPLHAPMTLAALAAGSHVLLEKPAAGTIQEVTAMQKAESMAGRFVAVAYQSLYTPEILRMKQAMQDGLIGPVHAIKCRGLWPRPNSYYERNSWAGRLRQHDRWVLDSPFNNGFAHWLNMLCFLAGRDLRGSARPLAIEAELYRTRPIESADTACLRIATEEGIPLLLWVSHSCTETEDPILEVRGERGTLVWTQEGISYHPAGGEAEAWPSHTVAQFRPLMYDAVLRRIAGEDTFLCGLDIAGRQTLCSNGAFESSPIHTIAPGHLTAHGEADPLVAIDAISDICRRAFQSESLWSEMGLPWAKKGRLVSLRDYSAFRLAETEPALAAL